MKQHKRRSPDTYSLMKSQTSSTRMALPPFGLSRVNRPREVHRETMRQDSIGHMAVPIASNLGIEWGLRSLMFRVCTMHGYVNRHVYHACRPPLREVCHDINSAALAYWHHDTVSFSSTEPWLFSHFPSESIFSANGSTSRWWVEVETLAGEMKHTHPQQFLFSGTLIGLTANRLHYTRHLPPGDPLNNGRPFYGLLTFLLWVDTNLQACHRSNSRWTLRGSGIYILLVNPYVSRRTKSQVKSSYRDHQDTHHFPISGTRRIPCSDWIWALVSQLSMGSLSCGRRHRDGELANSLTSRPTNISLHFDWYQSMWGKLSFCWNFEACRILTALVAFAWIGWITISALLFTTFIYGFTRDAWRKHSHGRWSQIAEKAWRIRPRPF